MARSVLQTNNSFRAQAIQALEQVALVASLIAAVAVAVSALGAPGLGNGAAVLYAAFLWVTLARGGWTMADHPQFYLVPVGLSAILFAEVNVRELGPRNVNSIRGIGSTVIYVSTAVPMWQFQSFGP